MNAGGGRDAIGVGLCVDTGGAVIAVARRDPLRLAAIATVTWPVTLWRAGPPPPDAMSAGRRVLSRARQRLGLPRWCPIVVVAGPSLSTGGTPDWVPPRGAQLLARAGLTQGWVITPQRAMTLRAGTRLTVPGELATALAGLAAELAVAASIAAIAPPDPCCGGEPDRAKPSVATSLPPPPGRRTETEPLRDTAPFGTAGPDRTSGWAVQRIGEALR